LDLNINNESLPIVVFIISILLYSTIGFIQSALSSVTREAVYIWKNEGRNRAEKLESLLRRFDQCSSAFSILKAVTLALSVVATNILVSKESGQANWDITHTLLTTAVTLLGLAIVETIIRTCVGPRGPSIAARLSGFTTFVGILLSPLTRSQERIIEIGSATTEEDLTVTNNSDGIAMRLDEEGEPLEEHEVRMIRGVFQLDKTVAREIMIPRVDMTCAEVSTSLDQVANIMLSSGHSKIPVYRDELDQIEGIAHSLDILRYMSDPSNLGPSNLTRFLRPVLYVPESKTLEDLLTEFQEKRMQMAIVVDEYGGVSGLATVEDLVEEIVGELHDEFDRGGPKIRKISESEYFMDAGTDIDDVSQIVNVSFEGDGFDTIGGFVLHQLGKIPSTGDKVKYQDIEIEILSTTGRRVRSLRIRKIVGDTQSK